MTQRRVLPADQRRAELLAAARQTFAEQGFHQTSIDDIVAKVGCAKGTFYNYFDSKVDVFGDVAAAMIDDVLAVVRPIDLCAPIPAQVRDNLERLVTAIAANDVARVLLSEAGGHPEADAALIAFYDAALARVEGSLRTGQSWGVVGPGDVRILARCLIGMLKEPVSQARLRGEALDAPALVEAVLGLVVHGALGR
jgi:AcrR family transcriptional regulator